MPHMKRDVQVLTRVSKEEKRDFDKLARDRRKTLSEIIRELLNREVRDSKKEQAA